MPPPHLRRRRPQPEVSLWRNARTLLCAISAAAVVAGFSSPLMPSLPLSSRPSFVGLSSSRPSHVGVHSQRIRPSAGSISSYRLRQRQRGRSVRLFAAKNEKADGDEERKEKQTDARDRPRRFLPRTLEKFLQRRRSGGEGDSDSDDEGDGDGDGEVKGRAEGDGMEKNNPPLPPIDDAERRVASLRALAERTRLEAELMSVSLTVSRIAGLEAEFEKLSSATSTEGGGGTTAVEVEEKLRSSIRSRARELARRLAPPPPKVEVVPPSETNGAETNDAIDDVDGDFPPISEKELRRRMREYDEGSEAERAAVASAAGVSYDRSGNATAIALNTYEYEQRNLARKERLKAIVGETVGGFGGDSTAVDSDADLAADLLEIQTYVSNMLPELTRAEPVPKGAIDAFYAQVLGRDIFDPSGKPQAVPGGYVIRGVNKVKSNDGENEGSGLVNAIDGKMRRLRETGDDDSSRWTDQITVHYILDPTPASGEEILNDEDELPLLFVTRAVVYPRTAPYVKPLVSALGLVSAASFAVTAFSLNPGALDRITAAADAAAGGGGDANLAWLYDAVAPLVFAFLGTQFAHELGHWSVALRDGIKIGPPTLVPGVQFGLTGVITPLESSPKNLKSLFDFAFAGPLLGIVTSLVLLYAGLEATVFMDPAARDQLPALPIQLLRTSSLGGAAVEYLMGDGLLNSPDRTEVLRLHPYAVAGYAGLVTNALSLLPIGNTDGGRICLAFFGRSFSRVVQGGALTLLVLAGLFGADGSNVLLFYAIFASLYQSETEVPCRDEVSELDSVRGFVAIAASVFVMLTLVPLNT